MFIDVLPKRTASLQRSETCFSRTNVRSYGAWIVLARGSINIWSRWDRRPQWSKTDCFCCANFRDRTLAFRAKSAGPPWQMHGPNFLFLPGHRTNCARLTARLTSSTGSALYASIDSLQIVQARSPDISHRLPLFKKPMQPFSALG